jgi:hypothetical protein
MAKLTKPPPDDWSHARRSKDPPKTDLFSSETLSKALERSKAVFGLLERFSKTHEDGDEVDRVDASTPRPKPAWDIFATFRGTRRKANAKFQSFRQRSVSSSSRCSTETRMMPHASHSALADLRPDYKHGSGTERRKSLYNLVGTISKKYSMRSKARRNPDAFGADGHTAYPAPLGRDDMAQIVCQDSNKDGVYEPENDDAAPKLSTDSGVVFKNDRKQSTICSVVDGNKPALLLSYETLLDGCGAFHSFDIDPLFISRAARLNMRRQMLLDDLGEVRNSPEYKKV